MAPLAWRVALNDLRKGFKVKSSSPVFSKGKHEFCLDVYRDGWGDEDREFVAVFVRYVSKRGTCKGVASVSLEGGPRWQAPEEVTFAPVADLEKRSRSGDRRFMSREAFLQLAERGPLEFTASVDPTRRLSQREISVAKDIEDMSEEDVREALLAVDREEVKGLTDPKVTIKGSSWMTQSARNAKFMTGLYPIVMRYLRVKKKVAKMRKQLKGVDREAYYDERTAMWDEAHEREAKAIRKLFDSMGGLYNKLAQDWATRDGLVPQAWVDELKHSFEGMPFREWSQMSKMLLRGLEGEGVVPVSEGKGLDAYFQSVDQTPLAAASIGQVHLATTYAGERVVVKAIYPEIRRYLIADLKNARKAAQQITWILKLPMKGTINAIMDEEVECFPRELDLRIEARHLKKQRLYQKRHGLDIAIPIVIDELSSSSVLTQTFLTGTTMGNCDVSDPVVRQKAIDACKDITHAIGVTLFRERFFHADPHPGNIMLVGDELKPGLIDFGQCTTLTKPQLRTVCQLVVLLRTRSQTLIDQALRGSGFGFNTEDPELKLALLYYFFDSSTTGSGVVRPEAMEILKDAIQHKPASMPVLTDTPREMVFYGRVCGTLRKSFEKLDADVSAVTIWYPEARKALQRLNAENPDPISSALLLLPENPDGLTYLVERAPVVLSRATEVMNSVGGGFSSSSEVGRGRALVGVAGLCAAMWYLRDALLVGMVAFAKLFLAGVVAAVVAGASPLNAVRALKPNGSKKALKVA